MSFKMKYEIKKDYIEKGTKRRSGIKMNKVKFVVLHDTGNPNSTAKGNVSYYKRSANDMSASAHLFVDDKEIIECVPALTDTPEKAWHVQYNKPKDNELFGVDANDGAIGVELCYGSKINSKEAYKRYVWVVAYICYKFDLDPSKSLVGHHILDPQRRTDPVNALKTMGKTYNQLLEDIVLEYLECTGKGEDKLRLEKDWQWKQLRDSLILLQRAGILDSDEWYKKVERRELTVSELAWLNLIVTQRHITGRDNEKK